jgi:N utilization substance protein A
LADITLDGEMLQQIALFERTTGVPAMDCLLTAGCAYFVVRKGGARRAQRGEGIERLSKRLGRRIELVESRKEPEAFMRSLFRPYGLESVELEETPEGLKARVKVRVTRKAQAIGRGGENLNALRALAARHAGVVSIVLD